MTADPYQTRVSSVETLLPRPDPVVFGEHGPLEPEQLKRYDTDGYLVLEELFDRQVVGEALGELEHLVALEGNREDPRFIWEPGSTQLKSIFEIHRISEFFRRLIGDTRLTGRAAQILGSEVYVHQTRVNLKPGFDGTDFYWHSDFETWHAEDGMPTPRALSVVLALTENLPINGPLMVIPGSHRTFVSCTGETPEANYRTSLVRQEIGLPSQQTLSRLAELGGVVQCLARPGTAIVFDSNLMHGSTGNITPFPRQSLFVVFNSVENALSEPFSAPARRPEFLAARDFTPLG
ncbi:ectoine hydroxylase [Dactylosporangium roseum]|uniref:Ectoine hydroxylase n=1 Tax=Dactylosporangium roseum TaxID=47989 RepID=A0ABY5Z2H8_9ACTN|nr:ectoine hydroxylase [Dactylosporangium roseum]UWZ36206.1 ectoine hydroxylase [Dactylosporangium roseum]